MFTSWLFLLATRRSLSDSIDKVNGATTQRRTNGYREKKKQLPDADQCETLLPPRKRERERIRVVEVFPSSNRTNARVERKEIDY